MTRPTTALLFCALTLQLLHTTAGLKLNRTRTFRSGRFNYSQLINYSLLFYEAQRSGRLPPTNRIPWRNDSMLNDKGDGGLDLTGGYFDAGDSVKFNFPMAGTTTVLAWGLLDFKEGYEKAGELENAMGAIRWATDYFIRCHPTPNVYYGQVGDIELDHNYWGRPEDWTGPRPAYKITEEKPGSDLAGETAAAFAASSLVFRDTDADYAEVCLRHAEQLYAFATKFRAKYSDSIPEAAVSYTSWSGYGDELAWAAAWLYRATGKEAYLEDTRDHLKEFGLKGKWPDHFDWDNKLAGVLVVLSKLTNLTEFKEPAEKFCEYVLNDVKRSPKQLVVMDQWGALRHAANVAFVCLTLGTAGINRDRYYRFGRQQIDYMIGASGRSFVVGYGKNPPVRPHHRSSSCPDPPEPCDWKNFEDPAPNPQTLFGALVGGPDQNDHYADLRENYVMNEVSLDYNAGFTSALAALNQIYA